MKILKLATAIYLASAVSAYAGNNPMKRADEILKENYSRKTINLSHLSADLIKVGEIELICSKPRPYNGTSLEQCVRPDESLMFSKATTTIDEHILDVYFLDTDIDGIKTTSKSKINDAVVAIFYRVGQTSPPHDATKRGIIFGAKNNDGKDGIIERWEIEPINGNPTHRYDKMLKEVNNVFLKFLVDKFGSMANEYIRDIKKAYEYTTQPDSAEAKKVVESLLSNLHTSYHRKMEEESLTHKPKP